MYREGAGERMVMPEPFQLENNQRICVDPNIPLPDPSGERGSAHIRVFGSDAPIIVAISLGRGGDAKGMFVVDVRDARFKDKVGTPYLLVDQNAPPGYPPEGGMKYRGYKGLRGGEEFLIGRNNPTALERFALPPEISRNHATISVDPYTGFIILQNHTPTNPTSVVSLSR